MPEGTFEIDTGWNVVLTNQHSGLDPPRCIMFIINCVVPAQIADWLTAVVYQTGYDKTCIFTALITLVTS